MPHLAPVPTKVSSLRIPDKSTRLFVECGVNEDKVNRDRPQKRTLDPRLPAKSRITFAGSTVLVSDSTRAY